MQSREEYMKLLKTRGKESRVYREYQLVGLELAELLRDLPRKALYIKLAKEHPKEKLMRLAKDVVERKGVKNKGAYFMRLLFSKEDA